MNYADLGSGLLDLQNSSYPTQLHSIIAQYPGIFYIEDANLGFPNLFSTMES